ncbi:Sugar-binding domain protein [uncultured Eubacteriales bacterium]|uniref:Sugar-binding domain protein n=1 Tax=uncultured Eubacteriales bacterium TaxID=172733 RepID=A0A212KGY9_9FIRM|nr:Sugar-binding domain protein [uncultured Eubacteriales bacterium]
MATLKELSDRTGYSPATISRILTADPSLAVTPEARQRVLEEAGKLNYAATKSRRGRAPKRLLRVGVAEMLNPAQRLEDPYYLYLRGGVERACADSRFAFLPMERQGEKFSLPEGEEVDGIVAIGIFTPEEIEGLYALCPVLVFLDSSPDEARSDSVVLNYRLGITQALDYLEELGHSEIAFVGPSWKLDDWKRPAPEERRRLFLELMARRGRKDPILIEAPMDARKSARAVAEFFCYCALRPTALICANEENAIGAFRALREGGLRVPEDISLISFNDTPLSQLIEPPLTSVSTHLEEMARTAVRLLAQRVGVEGKRAERALPQKTIVPTTLVPRASAAPPHGAEERKESNDHL